MTPFNFFGDTMRPGGTYHKEVTQVGWTQFEKKVRIVKQSCRTGRDYYQRDTPTIKTGGNTVVMPPTNPQDTFLNNEVGDTIRYIKENFGDSPLIEAYEAALDTFKEPDRRWKEYLEEEEAKFKSIFG
jgi:hypothetical protein